MTTQEAKASIGQPFKLSDFKDGLLGRFDTIREVTDAGYIKGDFIWAYAADCRLKNEQPEQLKKGE